MEAKVLADALAWAERAARAPRATKPPRQAAHGRSITNVLFISHCDFTGTSALHAYRIASELCERGLAPVIAVPDDPDTVEDVGCPPFPVISYRDAQSGRFDFPDGRGPDLVHAFTPRERVRRLAVDVIARWSCPYVVHLEDNDRAVLSAESGVAADELEQLPAPVLDRYIAPAQMHPLRGPHFVRGAVGVSVVVDRLLEFAPPDMPTAVVNPGFDEAVLSPKREREEVRSELGIGPGDFAVAYTGTIHTSNVTDMRRLYVALAALRREGHPIVFIKTGWHAPDAPELRQLGDAVLDLGWVPREALPDLLSAADVLVQPGVPGPFNDYRFPAKLPDFLASGRPVILVRTNVGLALEDRREAIVLEGGTAAEIYRAVGTLRGDPELARAIGVRGRAYALRIALLPTQPALDDAHAAREKGIYGFAFPVDQWSGDAIDDFPFCFRVNGDHTALPTSAFAAAGYITVGGEPLLVGGDIVEPPGLATVERVATPLPDRTWFRSISFTSAGKRTYEKVLSMLVLETLGRADAQEPLVFVEPLATGWLKPTRTAVRTGIARFYASRGLALGARSIDAELRLG